MEKIPYFYGMVHFQYNSGGPCARILQVFAVWRINVGGTTRLILNILTSIILQWAVKENIQNSQEWTFQ